MWRLMAIAIALTSLVVLVFCIDVTAEDAAEAATPAQHTLSFPSIPAKASTDLVTCTLAKRHFVTPITPQAQHQR